MEETLQKVNFNLSRAIVVLVLVVYSFVMYFMVVRTVSWFREGVQTSYISDCPHALSYEDAKKALQYNKRLDPDNDGRPCESKFPIEAKVDINPYALYANK